MISDRQTEPHEVMIPSSQILMLRTWLNCRVISGAGRRLRARRRKAPSPLIICFVEKPPKVGHDSADLMSTKVYNGWPAPPSLTRRASFFFTFAEIGIFRLSGIIRFMMRWDSQLGVVRWFRSQGSLLRLKPFVPGRNTVSRKSTEPNERDPDLFDIRRNSTS